MTPQVTYKSRQALKEKNPGSQIILWHATDSCKKSIYRQILKSENDGLYPRFKLKFFFSEEDGWIAVDNSDSNCNVEFFRDLSEAIDWLKEK